MENTEISKYLMKKMNKYKKNVEKTLFSKYTKQSLENIIDRLHVYNQEWVLFKKNISITPISNTLSDQFPKGTMYTLLESYVKGRIEGMPMFGNTYMFSINNSTIEIHIMYSCGEQEDAQQICNELQQEYFEKAIHRIYLWLRYAYEYKPVHCSRNLTIYLYLTDLMKLIPENEEVITTKHANTAFTTSCKPTTEIVLYREEEWFKVLIHETFHCLGLDFSHNQELSNWTSKQINTLFSTSTEILLFEPYCEINAELFNCIISVFLNEHREPEPNKSNLITEIENNLYYEKIFSIIQCNKILKLNKITYEDLLNNTSLLKQYREQTNTFAYYVLKSALMNHINEYFDWMREYNKNTICFQNNKRTADEFIRLINTSCREHTYVDNMRAVKKVFDKMSNTSLEYITMRMTVIET